MRAQPNRSRFPPPHEPVAFRWQPSAPKSRMLACNNALLNYRLNFPGCIGSYRSNRQPIRRCPSTADCRRRDILLRGIACLLTDHRGGQTAGPRRWRSGFRTGRLQHCRHFQVLYPTSGTSIVSEAESLAQGVAKPGPPLPAAARLDFGIDSPSRKRLGGDETARRSPCLLTSFQNSPGVFI